ncbi:MAG: hypothetical protein KBD39_11625 [Sterolibacterium sp.]|nr:hypothetical protein [Sterolibacterium sp.]MBP9800750.1 hypothetical protein [Sterolibacterium sp.]
MSISGLSALSGSAGAGYGIYGVRASARPPEANQDGNSRSNPTTAAATATPATPAHQNTSATTKDDRPKNLRGNQDPDAANLSEADQIKIKRLQQRDQEVRQHEMAHLAASGGLAMSGATYTFQRGPDGVSYAVGGEVRIDVSPGRNPEETQARARTIVAAALAPAEPSPQDRTVAAQARQMGQQAMQEVLRQQREEATQASSGSEPGPSAHAPRSKPEPGGSSDIPGLAHAPTHRGIQQYQQISGVSETSAATRGALHITA